MGNGALGRIRTLDRRIRSPMLYPAELRAPIRVDIIRSTVQKQQWHVYILLSDDKKRTYVGATCDLSRRLDQHNGKIAGGAKSTRAGRPWKLYKHFGPLDDRGAAQSLEAEIKALTFRQRLDFQVY